MGLGNPIDQILCKSKHVIVINMTKIELAAAITQLKGLYRKQIVGKKYAPEVAVPNDDVSATAGDDAMMIFIISSSRQSIIRHSTSVTGV